MNTPKCPACGRTMTRYGHSASAGSSPRCTGCLRSSSRTWAAPPTRISRGWRAYQGVNAHIQRFACERHTRPGIAATKTQDTSPTTPRCQRFRRGGRRCGRLPTANRNTTAPNGNLTASKRGGNCTTRAATRRTPSSCWSSGWGGIAPLEPRHAGDTPRGGS